ncbi:hypothetical protein [Streptomyces sp. NPDC008150]|uniref:hypothetical protein n=1 Tax=Streptomyces sp. NPDC008150 TaxID=3364816 RepID=UPI0036E16C53
MAHTVLGAAAGLMWLVLPGMTISTDVPVAARPNRPTARTVSADGDGPAADLVLPVAAVAGAGAIAGYGYLRRTGRRPRPRPRGPGTRPSLAELDGLAAGSLVEQDDHVRASREEVVFARAQLGDAAVEPFDRAVRDAATTLTDAFLARQEYDDRGPGDDRARRRLLDGVVGRCTASGRELDATAADFARLRALDEDAGRTAALRTAEARFRALAGRTPDTEALLAALTAHYGPAAVEPVTGYVEQVKDRLVFATSRLNRAHQSADLGDPGRAADHLRAAEGAIAQADVFLTAVDTHRADLDEAAATVPSALSGAETRLAEVRPDAASRADGTRSYVAHADGVLAAVRTGAAAGPHDPVDALRRIVRATAFLTGDGGGGDPGVLGAAAALVARVAVASAAGFVATHRGAVGAEARTRLAAARERLAAVPPDHLAADTLARRARELAERDVRTYGNPTADTAGRAAGVGGALLGGVLLGTGPDDGPPAGYGGPATQAARTRPAPAPLGGRGG